VTDDIVTRLRVTTVADSSHKIYATMTEAADEIERLRAQLQLAHSQIAKIATAKVEEQPALKTED
jgi:uncharacterized coiled-coil DUF342 family protein